MARGRLVVAVYYFQHIVYAIWPGLHTASQATQSSEGHILACILFTPRHLDLLLIKNDKPPNGCLPFPRSTNRHTRTVVYTQRDDAPSQQPPFNAHVASFLSRLKWGAVGTGFRSLYRRRASLGMPSKRVARFGGAYGALRTSRDGA